MIGKRQIKNCILDCRRQRELMERMGVIQEPSPSVERLLLWLANSSELAHLLSCDASLPPSLVTPLRSSLQALFHSLCRLAKTALEREIPDILNEHTDDEHAISQWLPRQAGRVIPVSIHLTQFTITSILMKHFYIHQFFKIVLQKM